MVESDIINHPTLTVRGNSNVQIAAHVEGGSVSRVEIIKNAFEFKEPLSIITTNNSNGYDIDAILVIVVLQLLLNCY